MEKERILASSVITLLLFVSLLCLANMAYGAFSPTLTSPAQTETTVTLSWTTSNDWLFSNYEVTYATSVNGPYYNLQTITNKDQTTVCVTGLSPSTDYYFVIQDSGSMVGTTPSNTFEVKTTSTPQIVITSRTATTASLQWTDYNTYSSKVPFQSYVVQMSTSGGSWSTLTTVTDVTQSTYTVTGLSPGTYDFRMYDEVGTSGQYQSTSNEATLVINPPVQVQISSSNPSVNVGQQAQFTASASGGTNSYSYQWFSNGSPISGATSATCTYIPTNAGTVTIYATAQDTQDSSLAVATSNSITLTATATPTPTQQQNSNANTNSNANSNTTHNSNSNSNVNSNPNTNNSGNQGIPMTYIAVVAIAIIAVIGVIIGLVVKQKQSASKSAR